MKTYNLYQKIIPYVAVAASVLFPGCYESKVLEQYNKKSPRKVILTPKEAE